MGSITKRAWVVGASVAVAVAAFACSGSSGSTANACISSAFAQGGTGCTTCIDDSCGSELGSFESACTDYINCVCPGGTYDSTKLSGCQATAKNDSSCVSADQTFATCLQNNCTAACTGTSSGSSSGSSSGGGGTVACVAGTGTGMTCTITPGVTSCSAGIASTSCPTSNVSGCCKRTGGFETCYYDPANVASETTACTQSQGMWATSP